jgi:soluble lytic murein transglycosylase
MIPGIQPRLDTAQRAFTNGDYAQARAEYQALLTDPGADPAEQRLALYGRARSELSLGETSPAIASLQQFVRQYPTDSLTRAAQFNLGRAYEQANQVDQAIQTYRGVIVPDDPVNVYIYQTIGNLLLTTGNYTDTIAAYQAGIEATDDASFKVHFRELIAQTELEYGHAPAIAVEQYQQILDMAKIPAYRAKILRLMGEAHRQLGNETAAFTSYREAVDNYPEAPDTYLALVELVDAGQEVDEFQRGYIDYHAKAYLPAIAAFERYLAQAEAPAIAPTDAPVTTTIEITATEAITATRTDEALWLMGQSHAALGQYNNAIATYQRLIDSYPVSAHWGQAHLEQGFTLIDQGSYSQAIETLRQFAAAHPASPVAPEALWRAARLQMGQEQFAGAHQHLHQLVERYPASQFAGEALYWAGQAAYLTEDYEEAIADWAALAARYPASDLVSFGSYWRARALEQLNRPEEAKAVLTELSAQPRQDYYHLRAKDRLTGAVPAPMSLPLALPSAERLAQEQVEAEAWLRQWLSDEPDGPLLPLHEAIQNNPAFRRGAALLEFGLRDKALIEFETVKDTWWNNPLAMYQLSHYFGQQRLGRLSTLAAARLIFLSPADSVDTAPVFIQRLFYPLFFEDVILAEAAAQEVEPALIAALIRQESLYEQAAESAAGARGLMQVMPATGQYVAERGDFGPYEPDRLWLPYRNIKFGAWYINQQLGIFENNLFAAMAAYNAGPGNVLEWQKTSPDLDIFVEAIPFWESRTYIRKVYPNLAAYRRLYGTHQ